MIGMNRFLTKGQIKQLYQIPGDVLPSVMDNVPVVHLDEDGEPHFVESDVDRAVDGYAASATGSRRPTCDPAPKGKPGRKSSTDDIALVVNELKGQGETWKEIVATCKSRFPGRIKNLEQVRTIWRRHFGGKE